MRDSSGKPVSECLAKRVSERVPESIFEPFTQCDRVSVAESLGKPACQSFAESLEVAL